MKIGLLSDIHSNDAGLRWALTELADVDLLFNLGDIVGYTGDVNRCFELLNDRKVVSLVGNHDLEALASVDPDSEITFLDDNGNPKLQDFGLREPYKKQIRKMPRVIRRVMGGAPFYFAHDFIIDEKNVYSEKIDARNIQRFLSHSGSRCNFLGGNHQWELFIVPPRGGDVEHENIVLSRQIPMEPDKAYVLYVGSTAIPSYGVVDLGTQSIEVVIRKI